MYIVCPRCTTSYGIAPASLCPNGRPVRCSRCKEIWLARPEDAIEGAEAPATAPVKREPIVDSPSIVSSHSIDNTDLVAPLKRRSATSPAVDKGRFENDPRANDSDQIFRLLGPNPISIDELVRMSGVSPTEARTILLELELAGKLERLGSGLVVRSRFA
jgi:DNA processing protein